MKCVDLFFVECKNDNEGEVSKQSQEGNRHQNNSFNNELKITQKVLHILNSSSSFILI